MTSIKLIDSCAYCSPNPFCYSILTVWNAASASLMSFPPLFRPLWVAHNESLEILTIFCLAHKFHCFILISNFCSISKKTEIESKSIDSYWRLHIEQTQNNGHSLNFFTFQCITQCSHLLFRLGAHRREYLKKCLNAKSISKISNVWPERIHINKRFWIAQQTN